MYVCLTMTNANIFFLHIPSIITYNNYVAVDKTQQYPSPHTGRDNPFKVKFHPIPVI